MKKVICIWITIFSIIILGATGCSFIAIPETPQVEYNDNQQLQDEIIITMLDVGQGLCVLFETTEGSILYDGGDREHSSFVVAYLKEHGIENIEYMVASHYDEDHIAGLIGVLNTISVKNIIIPQYKTDTNIYSSFMKAIKSAESIEYANTGDRYNLGDTTIDILYGCNGSESSENESSTVIKVSHGNFSSVLTGDAGYITENVLINNCNNLECTLYVVGHHGSAFSSSESFVNIMSPDYAFVSSGADNEYGHPAETTLDVLEKNNVTVYRTDIQGTIRLNYSNGKCEVLTEKDDRSIISQKEDTVSIKVPNEVDFTYILNTSSMKFHIPECSAVNKMAEHNKEYSLSERNILIEEGYSPCGMCNP